MFIPVTRKNISLKSENWLNKIVTFFAVHFFHEEYLFVWKNKTHNLRNKTVSKFVGTFFCSFVWRFAWKMESHLDGNFTPWKSRLYLLIHLFFKRRVSIFEASTISRIGKWGSYHSFPELCTLFVEGYISKVNIMKCWKTSVANCRK